MIRVSRGNGGEIVVQEGRTNKPTQRVARQRAPWRGCLFAFIVRSGVFFVRRVSCRARKITSFATFSPVYPGDTRSNIRRQNSITNRIGRRTTIAGTAALHTGSAARSSGRRQDTLGNSCGRTIHRGGAPRTSEGTCSGIGRHTPPGW
jgi:hypothetical protein